MAKSYSYQNSKVSAGLHEPIYTNLFEVSITPPPLLTSDEAWGDTNRELLLEEIISINGLDVDKLPALETQKFKGVTRKFIGVVPGETTVLISFTLNMNLNENNQNYVYNMLRKWSDLCYDPLTGVQTLKKDYTSQSGLTVTGFNKVRDVFRKWEIKNIFPAEPIPAWDFNYEQNTPMQTTFKFHGDYFGNQYK